MGAQENQPFIHIRSAKSPYAKYDAKHPVQALSGAALMHKPIHSYSLTTLS
jgi:hypothetical protein